MQHKECRDKAIKEGVQMNNKLGNTKDFSAVYEVDSRGKSIQVHNGLIKRIFSYEDGFRTSALRFEADGRNLVDPKHKLGIHGETAEETAPCREAMIGIDGIDYNIGLGEGFSYIDHRVTRGEDKNLVMTVQLQNQQGLKLEIHTKVYDNEPFIIKWIELYNGSKNSVSITACQPEVLTMPASGSLRWHECTRKVYPTGHVISSTKRPFTYWTYDYSPVENQPMIWVDHFTSRPQKFGFAIANNYVRRAFVEGFETKGKEIQLPALPGMICSCGHRNPGEVFTQFPVGPNVLLKPGEKFVSFKTYMVFFEGGYEDGGLALRRMIKRLCPWITDFHTRFEHTYWKKSISKKIRKTNQFDMTPLTQTMDQAAELGFDYWYFTLTLWAQSFGEFRPRPEFPDGAEDMRRVSEYAHKKGLKIAIHTPEDYGNDFKDHFLLDDETGEVHSYNIGAPGDFIKKHPEYRLINEGGNQARGWVMCGAGGYHEHLMKVKIPFVTSVKCNLLDNDGCYYGDLCYASNHGHHSPEEAQYHNWRLAVERYKAYREAGFEVMAPDGVQSLFNGNAGTATYHTEASTRYEIYDFILDLRKCLYKSSYYHPTTAMVYSVWCDPAVMNGVDVTQDSDLLNYYFASLASYGVNLGMLGITVYKNELLHDTVKRWIGFMKKYHEILCQDIIHLAEPNPRDIDAVMHIAPGKKMCGLLAAFNPTVYSLKRQFIVPERYLASSSVTIQDVWDKEASRTVAGKDRNFIFEVKVPARGFRVFSVT